MNFWAVWREDNDVDKEVFSLINKPLSNTQKDNLFQNRFKYVRTSFDAFEKEGDREITEQDRLIFALPSRTAFGWPIVIFSMTQGEENSTISAVFLC